jgi:hypothetical protein
MEVIKRKISFEDITSREYNTTYGSFTGSGFTLNVMLTQTMDDMGMFTDVPFETTATPDYTALLQKYSDLGLFPTFVGGTVPTIVLNDDTSIRVVGKPVMDYYAQGGAVTGLTDSKLVRVKSFSSTNPYQVGLSMVSETYENFKYAIVNGETKLTVNGEPREYVIDKDDLLADTGIRYETYTGTTLETPNGAVTSDTSFEFNSEGWNKLNSSLSAITKEEYLMGIINPPEVQSDVFIDRGSTTVMEKHLRLSEIESVEHLVDYGNGFYKIAKTKF